MSTQGTVSPFSTPAIVISMLFVIPVAFLFQIFQRYNMGQPVVFSDTTSASPQTIWETCIEPLQWESWDNDVKQVVQKSGGCETGTTFAFDMKDGSQIPVSLTNVVKQEAISYHGNLAGGTVQIKSTIELQPTDNNLTQISYSFQITGLLGPVVNILKWKMIVDGTKTGLENIIQLSEEAETAKK